ncbi:cyclic nucleotide-binding domain-containing protein [Aquihabitans sp. McL0605]|uniref:cyclic nucleotide-binding domain-containing protein n=1 Tax=Aquihabitans sp. McL0605 TaxID=3415671 RepID=UPI003CF2AFAA
MTGLNKAIFGTGFTHYDDPPPDEIHDLHSLADTDRFRFANHLAAWISVEDGQIIDAGYSGSGVMGATTVAIGPKQATFAALSFPDLTQPVQIEGSSARFVQTVGGHTAIPAPRRVKRPPFVAFQAPVVWTTLALTIHADGTSEHELVGASPFPRHWVYDAESRLTAKGGLADFKEWWRTSFGLHTPWGDEESAALVTEVETALEREVAGRIMRGGEKPSYRQLREGELLTTEGAAGAAIYLLLNGVLAVDVDDETVAEVGPGAILGERAVLEGGTRTSTLRALTRAKVAIVQADQVDPAALADISQGHRREEHRVGSGGGAADG